MLTIANLVDAIEPHLKAAIDAELPFGTRWVAHQIARWKIRKIIQLEIARYGHQVAPVLGEVEAFADRFFRAEVAQALRDLKALCETPLSELGAGAAEARAAAGPAIAVTR